VANIDQGFSVDILSLSDNTLVTASTFDPSAVGFEAPEGSLFAYKHVTNSALFLKTGPLNTDWTNISVKGITAHPALTNRNDADQHIISSITGLQLALDNKSNINHVHSLDNLTDVDVSTVAPTAGQTLVYDGTNWINLGTTAGSTGGGAAKRIWSGDIAAGLGTTQIYPSVSPPAITAGTELWNTTITDPWSTTATYVIQTNLMVVSSKNNANLTLALFRDVGGVPTYLGGTVQIVSSGNNSSTLSFSITDKPNTLQPITYSIRVGTNTGTWYVNRRMTEMTYGGTNTGWVMWEY